MLGIGHFFFLGLLQFVCQRLADFLFRVASNKSKMVRKDSKKLLDVADYLASVVVLDMSVSDGLAIFSYR